MLVKKKVIKEINNQIENLEYKIKNLNYNNEILEAQLFNLKYPDGRVSKESAFPCFGSHIYFQFVSGCKIQQILLYNLGNCISIKSYKIFNKNTKAYIGLKYDTCDSEKYFIVDKIQNIVIEYDKTIELDSVEWIDCK